MQIVSNEISNPVSWEKIKKYFKISLLKFLTRVLSIKNVVCYKSLHGTLRFKQLPDAILDKTFKKVFFKQVLCHNQWLP